MLPDLILIACGLVLLAGVVAVLKGSRRGELSIKTISALLIGAWGFWLVVSCVQAPAHREWPDVLGPLGVALWILRAMWKHKGRPMRRSTDFAGLDAIDSQ